MITDHYQLYVKAVATSCPATNHTGTGLHRARGESLKLSERSHGRRQRDGSASSTALAAAPRPTPKWRSDGGNHHTAGGSHAGRQAEHRSRR
jgi:hypothetical protein